MSPAVTRSSTSATPANTTGHRFGTTRSLACGSAPRGSSPVKASNTYGAAAGYFPDQYVNQAKDVLPAIDEFGDSGLDKTFPAVDPSSWTDSTPEMYS